MAPSDCECPERYLSLAGFEVTFIGRFWVTAEGPHSSEFARTDKM
jgi:hypothetical protein